MRAAEAKTQHGKPEARAAMTRLPGTFVPVQGGAAELSTATSHPCGVMPATAGWEVCAGSQVRVRPSEPTDVQVASSNRRRLLTMD